MAAFFPVTDSLTGELVIVNADMIQAVSERRGYDGYSSTVIRFQGTGFVQASEHIETIYSQIMRLGCKCLNADFRQWDPLQTGDTDD